MLREINENEMMMVSGGTDPAPSPVPNPNPDIPNAPTIWGDGVGSPDGDPLSGWDHTEVLPNNWTVT